MLFSDYQGQKGHLALKAGNSAHNLSVGSRQVHTRERCGGGDIGGSGCGMWKPKGKPCPHCQSQPTRRQVKVPEVEPKPRRPRSASSACLALGRGSSAQLLNPSHTAYSTVLGAEASTTSMTPSSPEGSPMATRQSLRSDSYPAGGSGSLPISRYSGEETELQSLAAALRDASLSRSECTHALESLAHDFERDFGPGRVDRPAASALVVKSTTIVGRMTTACSALEAAAATCLNISKLGAAERESMIGALQDDVHRFDERMDEARAAMDRVQQTKFMALELAEKQTGACALVMATELQRCEGKIDMLRAEVAACHRRLSSSLEDERSKVVAHLQQQAVRRLFKIDMARGWTSWLVEYRHGKMLRRRAMLRFRNTALARAYSQWTSAHPPMSRVRRAVEPYRIRIEELQKALRKEEFRHLETRTALEARLNDTEEVHNRRREAERQRRVEHLLHVAIKRTLKLELARGWTQWWSATVQTKQQRLQAASRFRNAALYSSFRTWRMAYPPRDITPDDLIQCQQALETEREAHEKTRKHTEKLKDKWEAKFALYQEAVQTSATLQCVVRDLQGVLREALEATSWTNCRQVLYHESLRYVPSAATHGRGGLWRKAAKHKAELGQRLARGWSVGTLVDGSSLEKVLTWPNSLRDSPSSQSLKF